MNAWTLDALDAWTLDTNSYSGRSQHLDPGLIGRCKRQSCSQNFSKIFSLIFANDFPQIFHLQIVNQFVFLVYTFGHLSFFIWIYFIISFFVFFLRFYLVPRVFCFSDFIDDGVIRKIEYANRPGNKFSELSLVKQNGVNGYLKLDIRFNDFHQI